LQNDASNAVTLRLPVSKRALLFLALTGLALATTGFGAPGYLAVVGPVPLRFLTLPKPPAKKFVLPPPVHEAASNAPAMPIQPLPSSTLDEHVSSAPPANQGSAPQQLPMIVPVPQQTYAPAAQEPVVSTQMLLHFFDRPHTNSAPTAPLQFAPPSSGPASPPPAEPLPTHP
jgi:hypothetical protein